MNMKETKKIDYHHLVLEPDDDKTWSTCVELDRHTLAVIAKSLMNSEQQGKITTDEMDDTLLKLGIELF